MFQVAKNSGQSITRHTLVIAHVLMIALHVQQLNGQIEAHFGFFVMTGMFFIYRDWKLFVTTLVVGGAYHVIFLYITSHGHRVLCIVVRAI